MSEPKRWELWEVIMEETNSEWVRFEDYARLKAEVERLTALVESNLNSSKVAMRKADAVLHERDSLKAEVERLISVSEAWKKRRLDKVEAECIKWSDYEKLKAEVERLRKAGDAMAEAMWYGDAERSIWVKKFAETDWKAAREGKQP